MLEAEPLVGEYRRRHTPSGAEGMPAHVTLLVPFVDSDELDEEQRAAVEAIMASVVPFDVVFGRCAYFDDEPVLYLEPAPATPFAELTAALVRSFPEHLPYAGAHPDPTPHLTVATRLSRDELERVAHDLERALPLRARVSEAWLVEHSGDAWRRRARFPLGAA